jgi:PAS domain S-box-containing protein
MVRTLSVRSVVLALVLALAGIVVASAIVEAVGQMAHYRSAQAVLEVNRAVDDLLQGGQNLAFERGRTNVMLRAAGPIGDTDRRFINERRAAAEKHIGDALASLPLTMVPPSSAIRARYQSVQALRLDADAAMALPRDERLPGLSDRWFQTLSQMLGDIEAVIADVTLQGAQTWPRYRQYSRMKLGSFRLRDVLGVESSRIASAMAAGKLSGPEIARLRGESNVLWHGLQREVQLIDNSPLHLAAAQIESEMFNHLRPLQGTILAALESGQVPPVSVADYTKASIPALDSVASFMHVAAQEARSEVMTTVAASRSKLWQQVMIAAGAVALASGTMLVLVFGLLRPAEQIGRRILDLAAGRLDLEPLPVRRWASEATRMRDALAVLQGELSERSRLNAELVRLSHLSQLILDSAGEGIVGLDAVGNTIFANRQAALLTGWSASELIGRNHHQMVHHTKPDGATFPADECPVSWTLQDGQTRQLMGDTFWRRDGSIFSVDMTVNPLLDGRQVTGAVIVFRDATERRRAAQENQRLLDDLTRSNADLELFATAISHDLQAPLRMVASYVGLIERRYRDALDQEGIGYIGYAVEGAKRMSHMISGLLEYARAGTRGEPPTPVDLEFALAEVLESLSFDIKERGAVISIDRPLQWVMADPTQLMSVLQNLIGNALKYRRPDAAPRVHIAARPTGDHVLITVDDNGLGIAADDRDRVFGVFQRASGHESIAGLGMGLAICRRIVERLGGRIRAEASPQGGTRIAFTLPLAAGTTTRDGL